MISFQEITKQKQSKRPDLPQPPLTNFAYWFDNSGRHIVTPDKTSFPSHLRVLNMRILFSIQTIQCDISDKRELYQDYQYAVKT